MQIKFSQTCIVFEYFFKQVKNMNKKEFKEFLKIVNIDYETL